MKRWRWIALCALLLLPLLGTGCFRVGSEARILRDTVLDGGFARADQKVEVGAGFFTIGLAKMMTQYVDIPPEAREALSSVKHLECAVYEVHERRHSLATILADADEAMTARGCERLVGVVQRDQLVAVYVPRNMNSTKDVSASVLVLNNNQLVCASARADARQLFQMALQQWRKEAPPRSVAAAL